MLHTCVASTDLYLTTTGRVRQIVMGATSTDTSQDAVISAAILVATRWAEQFVGYPLAGVASYQETRPSYGRRNLMLSRTPVRAVRRLYDSTDTGEATQVYSSEFRAENRDAGFLSRDLGWQWTVPNELDLAQRPSVGQEYNPWLVDYVAGYTYNGLDTGSPHWSTEQGTTSTGRTLPEDIEEAVAQRAASIVTNDDDVVKETLGDLSIQYRSLRVDDPSPGISEALLGPYRRMV